MKMDLVKFATAIYLIVSMTSAYANPGNLFNVSATGTPANITITLCLDGKGPLSCQRYTVSAMTLSIATTIAHAYPNAGIFINTPGYTPTGCTTISNGYCLFGATNTATTPITIQSSTTKMPRYAYVGSDDGAYLTQCNVNNNTGALTGCNTTSPFPYVEGIAINSAGTKSYVSTYDNVQLCNIDSSTGTFTGCATTATGLVDTYGITLNPAGTFAYVANETNVYKCSVNPTTGTLSGCSTTGSGLNDPVGITFNQSGTLAYIGQYSGSTVGLCQVAGNGDFTSCIQTGSGFSDPFSVALNPAGTFAYVGNYDTNAVFLCNVNAGTGELSNCHSTGSGFDYPWTVVLNPAGTYAYAVNYYNTVTLCNVTPSTGELYGCGNTGSGFDGTSVAMAFLSQN